MKTKILSGLICCLGIFSANAQTITAPVGQSLTVTNPIDITVAGGTLNVPSDGAFKIGGSNVLSNKGNDNIFLGANTGIANTVGSQNAFFGKNAGQANTQGTYNVFIGFQAGQGNTLGSANTMIGGNAGASNTIGEGNFFMGFGAGFKNVSGNNNLFMGKAAGTENISGEYNTLIGFQAGANSTLTGNTMLGANTGYNVTGTNNVLVGAGSGFNSTTGSNNVFMGNNAGLSNGSGSSNTYLGNVAGGSPGISNSTALGANSAVSTSNTIVLGNAATTITGAGLASGSGLKFANITNASPATPGPTGTNGKVLSVDGSGNVILVQITGAGVSTSATGPVAESKNMQPIIDNLKELRKDATESILKLNEEVKAIKPTWTQKGGFLHNMSENGVVIEGKGFNGQALVVRGKMLSEEVNVQLQSSDWPDYVFKPNYKRMTLGEVEKFISINGHLPNIPSATEMAKTGNNLGQTDVKLLEKVEELTLYLLDMKKANDAQAAELKALKQQVSKLRKK